MIAFLRTSFKRVCILNRKLFFDGKRGAQKADDNA